MRDIAQRLGMHHTTVSLALCNSSLLREETRKKICDAAIRLGYRPDPMLSALNTYRHSKHAAAFQAVIGWIDNWKGEPGKLLKVPTYKAYYEGARARAAELGYTIEIFRMHEKGMTPHRMQQIFRARNVGGVLVAPQEKPGNYLGLDFSDTAALAFGFSSQPWALNLITARHEQIMDLILEKIHRLGYRRPGYCVLPESDAGSNHTWISRWNYFLSVYEGMVRLPRMETLERAALGRWIKEHKPDVLVGFGDLLGKVESLGYEVPKDLGFACIATDEGHARASGVDQNDVLIGRTAVDVLVGMIHRNEKGLPKVPIRTFVDCSWFEGETLRPQKLKPKKLHP
jgi:LacI family transcriptional regulator